MGGGGSHGLIHKLPGRLQYSREVIALVLLLQSRIGILDFALGAWAQDRDLHIEDAYKWLFQATRGAEHALGDRKMVTAWLDEEWAGLKAPIPGEPLFVNLRPDGKLVRLNLRPFRAKGGTKSEVLKLFLHAGTQIKGSKADFEKVWSALGRDLQASQNERVGTLTYADWTKLDRKTRQNGFPAIEHSPAYERARKPSYRLAFGPELTYFLRWHRK
jgi:hypothetical protein